MNDASVERVVEMRFNNEQFEKNVQTSLNTLGKLKEALNLDGATKGFDELGSAIEHVDLTGISAGIDALNQKFSFMGVAARNVVKNLVDDVYGYAKKLISFFPNQIIQGGIKRAMNIEQAKFQLEGLKVAWEDISDDINYAVDQTAYGLDAAAVAASQLVASGVEFGKTFGETGNSPMAKALRGISGVAAMTNRDYSEIARIFTTVAGNGRMMGDQLNQLGERGINAAAEITKFFNKVVTGEIEASEISEKTHADIARAMEEYGAATEYVESDIRDMTSQGLISFSLFSEAMDNAFGEHAKDANKTFTGAMSNIKAALSRVGADFVSPLIKQEGPLVNLFNAVRERVNNIRKLTSTLVAPGVTKFISSLIDKITKTIHLADVETPFHIIRNIALSLKNILSAVWSVLKSVGQAFKETFSFAGFQEGVLSFTRVLRRLTSNFKISESTLEGVKNIFKGLFSAIDIVGRVLGFVLKIGAKVITVVLKYPVKWLGMLLNLVVRLAGWLLKWIAVVDDLIKKHDIFNRAAKAVCNVIDRAAETVKNVVINVAKTIARVFLAIINGAKNLGSRISQPFKKFANLIKTTFKMPRGLVEFKDKLLGLFNDVKQRGGAFGKLIGSFTRSIKDFIKGLLTGADNIKELQDRISRTFGYLKSFIARIVADAFGAIKFHIPDGLKEFANQFAEAFKAVWETIKEIGSAIGNFLKVFFGGTEDLTPAIKRLGDSFGSLGSSLGGFFKTIGSGAVTAVTSFWSFIKEKFTGANGITESIDGAKTALKNFATEKFDAPDVSGLSKFRYTIHTLFKNIQKEVGAKFSSFIGNIANYFGDVDLSGFEKVKEKIIGAFKSIGDALKGVDGAKRSLGEIVELPNSEKFVTFKEKFVEVMSAIGDALKRAFKDVDFVDIVNAIVKLLVSGGLVSFLKRISAPFKAVADLIEKIQEPMTSFKEILEGFKTNGNTITGAIKGVLTGAKDALNDFSKAVKADILKKVAVAIAILSAALIALSFIDPEKIKMPLAAISLLMTELGVLMAISNKGTRVIDKNALTGVQAFAKNMAALGGVIWLLSRAMVNLSKIENTDKLVQATEGMLVILGGIILFLEAWDRLNIQGFSPKQGAALVLMAGSILILSQAVKLFGNIDPKQFQQGMIGVIGSIAVMAAAGAVMDNDNVLKAANSMIIMSAALMIMAGAVAIMGSIPWDVMLRGFAGIGIALVGMSVSLQLIKNANVNKAAAAMVVLSAALLIMAGAIAVMGSIPWKVMLKGWAGIGVSLAAMTIPLKVLGDEKKSKNVVKAAAAMVVMSAALLIMAGAVATMGSIPRDKLITGLAGIAGTMLLVSMAFKAIENTNVLKIAASMVVMATALVIMAGAVAAMGAVGGTGIIAGLAGIAGVLLTFSLAARLCAGLELTLLALAAAIGAFGVAIALVGVGLLAFATALSIIVVVGEAAALVFASMFEILVKSILNTIVNLADAIADAISKLIQIVVYAIIDQIDTIVQGFMTVIEATLEALVEHGPIIVGLLLDFLIGVLESLRERLPELLDVAFDVIGTFITMLIDRLKEADPTYLIDALKVFGLLSALVVAASLIAPMIPTALLGVAGLTAIAAELTLALTAIGALASIPGIQDFVNSGGTMLKAIGDAIGGFIGSIIGGVLEGISGSFPQIGQDLTDFMTNASGFIEGAKDIPAGTFEGIKALAEAMLLLTANDLLNAVTSWLTGGSSLSKFAQELSDFADPFMEFADKIKEVDASAVDSVGRTISILATAAKELPNSGGLVAKFTGENSLAAFGKELADFAPSIVEFSTTVDGKISEGAVQAASNAISILSAAAKDLPNSGGLAAKIFGDNSLAEFGAELKSFAPDIVYFSAYVDGRISKGAVDAASNAITILSNAAKGLPNSEGLAAKIFGNNNLSAFGAELAKFGPDIVDFSQTVDGNINETAVTAAANAAKILVELANQIPETGGILSWFTGNNDIGKFGESLVTFGTSLVTYSTTVKDIDTAKMSVVSAQLQALVDLANGISSVDTSGLANFASNMKTYALNGLNGFVEAFNDSNADSVVSASVATLISFTTSAMSTHAVDLKDGGKAAGIELVFGIHEGIVEKQPDVNKVTGDVCLGIINKVKDTLQKKIFMTYGSLNVAQGLMDGINQKRSAVIAIVGGLCTAIITAMNIGIPRARFRVFGANAIQGLIDGLYDSGKRAALRNAAYSLTTLVVSSVNANTMYNAMYQVGARGTQGLINGLNSKINELARTARENAKRVVDESKKGLDERSPSHEMYWVGEYAMLGLINGLVSQYSNLQATAYNTATSGVLTPMQEAIARAAELIENGIDAEPTIRPVLDLSNIQNGVQSISGLFSNGLNVSASYGRALDAGTTEDGTPIGGSSATSTNYNFTQNNYSPKALSRNEIYRQTKNQFAAMKGAVGSR